MTNRSNLVTPLILREFEEFQRSYHAWCTFWRPLQRAERDLFRWDSKRNTYMAEHLALKYDLNPPATRDIANSLNEAFLVGFYFGERRYTVDQEHFSWLEQVCDEVFDDDAWPQEGG